jgi:hypothetical protein
MYLKLNHREEGCTTSLTGCVGLNLVLRLQMLQSQAGISGHVMLGAGEMCLVPWGIRSIPTAAMELLLDVTPLDLLIMAEARMTLYRVHIPTQTADSGWAVIYSHNRFRIGRRRPERLTARVPSNPRLRIPTTAEVLPWDKFGWTQTFPTQGAPDPDLNSGQQGTSRQWLRPSHRRLCRRKGYWWNQHYVFQRR